MEAVQYCGVIHQYYGGYLVLWRDTSVHVGDSVSTVKGYISTVEAIQYCGGITSVHVGDNISTVGRYSESKTFNCLQFRNENS